MQIAPRPGARTDEGNTRFIPAYPRKAPQCWPVGVDDELPREHADAIAVSGVVGELHIRLPDNVSLNRHPSWLTVDMIHAHIHREPPFSIAPQCVGLNAVRVFDRGMALPTIWMLLALPFVFVGVYILVSAGGSVPDQRAAIGLFAIALVACAIGGMRYLTGQTILAHGDSGTLYWRKWRLLVHRTYRWPLTEARLCVGMSDGRAASARDLAVV